MMSLRLMVEEMVPLLVVAEGRAAGDDSAGWDTTMSSSEIRF